jgi:mono/diheme cytochrome c family protein
VSVIVIGLCHAGEPAATGKTATTKNAVPAEVRALYKQRCQRCHEADGTGNGDTPDFTDPGWQRSRTDLQLLVSILDGKGTAMPGFRGKVTDTQGRELVSLTRAFARNTAEAADDFSARFRLLQEELESLQKQFRELSASARPDPRPAGGYGSASGGSARSAASRSSATGCGKTSRFGDGPTSGDGGPRSCQRRR